MAQGKKAVGKKQTRRKMTPEFKAELLAVAAEGGPAAVAKKYGYVEAYAKQLITKFSDREPAQRFGNEPLRQERMQITRAISAYLDEVSRRPEVVVINLGALKGFPAKTTDPEVGEKAIAYIESVVLPRAASGVGALKTRQRILTLRRQVAQLRSNGNGSRSSAKAGFIQYGAAWAAENGITYAAFRDSGVSAAVLREAGIKP